MTTRRFLLVLLLVVIAAGLATAGQKALFTLKDPVGDDNGDGTLIYPARPDLNPGDLDLVEFSAEPDDAGTWFVATFARTIREPGPEPVDAVGTTMAKLAKYGFYTFNIDVYIDTDRVDGVGFTGTLPGRKATIDPATAWEKVICLSPRPDQSEVLVKRALTALAKSEVKKNKPRVDSVDVDNAKDYAKQTLSDRFYFPTKIQVMGRKIRFFVPVQFLGGTARPDWAYTVVVTGADVVAKLDSTTVLGKTGTPAGPDMMLIPIQSTRSQYAFGGREDDELQPPIVDLIVPEGQKQSDVLKNYDLRTGKMVVLTGVVPSGK